MTLDDKVKLIVTEMLEHGAPSITTIHTALVTDHGYDHSYSSFYNDFRKMKFKTLEGFGKRGRKKKRDITPALAARIQEMLDSGEYDTIPEVYNEVKQDGDYSLGDNAFYTAFKETGFKTPEYFGERRPTNTEQKHKRDRDALIFHDPPLTSVEIAKKESEKTGRKVTREAIRSYMERHCLHKGWKERRKAYLEEQREKSSEENELKEQLQRALQTLCTVINSSYYIQRALQEDKPKGFAAAYYYSMQRRPTNISLEKLEGFFEDYFAAQEGNVTKTLEELGEKHSIHPMTASRVLSEVGLEPLYGSLERKVTPKYKKDALQRATALEMSAVDIAYFLGVENDIAYHNMRLYGKAKGMSVRLALFVSGKNKEYLFYKHASQIYEALECGFTSEETRELANVSPNAYNFITQNRTTFEPVIINALRTIYAAPTHSLPYVTAELREHLKGH